MVIQENHSVQLANFIRNTEPLNYITLFEFLKLNFKATSISVTDITTSDYCESPF